MSQGRHGIKILGLSLLAALGLMAFAASAQAGEYTIEGKTFTSKGVASETVTGTGEAGKLLVPGLGLTVACTGGTGSGTVLLGGVAHATILFSGCSVEGNKFCKTFETKAKMESETEPGFISASGLGELLLMGGEHYILVSSTEGAPFTSIYFTKSTKGCTLPLEEPVFGCAIVRLLDWLTPLLTHVGHVVAQSEIESLFPTSLLNFGNQRAWLDGGSLTVSLSGANKGKTWGGE